jgi:hypothetical protein
LQANASSVFSVDAAGNVSAAGNISIASGKTYQINGTQISSANLSNDSNLAKLNATQTFSGANTFSNASNSFSGDGSNLTSLNASNVSSGTLSDARLSSNVALLNGSGPQTFTGNNKFTGTVLAQNATNSTTAFQIQNAAGTSNLFVADTTNNKIGLGGAPGSSGATLQVTGDISATTKVTANSGAEVLSNQATLIVSTSANSGDYTDIQSAINALPASGGKIFIKAGTYALGSTGLTIPVGTNNVVIEGEGTESVNITYSGSAEALKVGANTGDTRFLSLSNLTITGSSSGASGIRLIRVKNSYFANLHVTAFSSTSQPGHGFFLDGTNSYTGDNYFNGIFVDASEEGIALSGPSNANYFTNGTIRTTTSDANARAINMSSGNGNSFVGFNIENSTTGVRVNAGKNTFTNIRFESNTTAISILSGVQNTYLSNMVNAASNTTFLNDQGSGTIFTGNGQVAIGGNTSVKLDSTTAFQIQNASSKNLLTADTTNSKVILGTAGASGITGLAQFNYSGSSGSISLTALDPSSTAYTLSLPAENGTLCSTGSICAGYASATSVSNKLNKNSADTSSASVLGNLYGFSNTNTGAAGVLSLSNSGTNSTLSVSASANPTAGQALILANNTNASPSGNLLDLQANASSVFSVDAAGNVSAAGNISIASGKTYQINGTQISSANLSNDSNLAKLNATQTFSGANTFSNASNSFSGDGSNLTSLNASNVSSGTLSDARLSSNVALLNRTGQVFTGDNTFSPTGNNVGTVFKQTSGTATSGSVLDVQTANGSSHFLQITNAAPMKVTSPCSLSALPGT